jgi:hypothetical protein
VVEVQLLVDLLPTMVALVVVVHQVTHPEELQQ